MKNLIVISVLIATTLSLPTATTTNATVLPREINVGKDANIKILAFVDAVCGGGKFDNGAITNDKEYTVSGMRSYWLSRDLDPAEQLDFSMPTSEIGTMANGLPSVVGPRDNSQCAVFVQSATEAHGGKTAGCHDLERTVKCFRLWHH